MAIREVNYTVTESGITPATEQRVSMQTEHNVVRLNFKIDSELYKDLHDNMQIIEASRLVYRFDCYNDAGERIITPPNELEQPTVYIDVEEPLTRYGGLTTVYLVITGLDSSGKTAYEMRCYPARLRIESIPDPIADVGEVRRSLSTIAESAKMSEETALRAADDAVDAANRTILAQTALETGSEFYFDGNLVGEVAYVVDDTLNAASENAIANRAVTLKFSELEALIASTVEKTLQAVYPDESLFLTLDETADPNELFDFGRWTYVGKVTVGYIECKAWERDDNGKG